MKLCAVDSHETGRQAAELLGPFTQKLAKTKMNEDASAAANQQERNLVTATVRALFTLHSQHQYPPHPLVDRHEFRDLVREANHSVVCCRPLAPDQLAS